MRHAFVGGLLAVGLWAVTAHALDDYSVVRGQVADWWGYWFQKDGDAAARLKNDFDAAWARESAKTRAPRPGENPSDFVQRIDLAEASFLCQWMKTHAPPGNPRPMYLCDARSPVSEQAQQAQKADQAAAEAQHRAAAEQREAADRAAAERSRVALQRAQEELAAEAAKRETDFARHVSERSNTQLCSEYSANRYRSAREELLRRKVLSTDEWTLVDRGQVRIGMSELALICSFGNAPINRTVTVAGARKQYVYRDSTYVYVENGRVVAFQDHP